MTHFRTFEREDGAEVEVEFSLIGGSSGCAPSLSYPGDPPEAPEVELVGVHEGEVPLNIDEIPEAEKQRWFEEIVENLGDYDDDDYEPDYWGDE